jgi:hypothetical protein
MIVIDLQLVTASTLSLADQRKGGSDNSVEDPRYIDPNMTCSMFLKEYRGIAEGWISITAFVLPKDRLWYGDISRRSRVPDKICQLWILQLKTVIIFWVPGSPENGDLGSLSS